MHKRIISLLMLTFLFVSCAEKKISVLTPAQKKARLDSVLRIQQAEIKEMEAESLRDRMSIEVKEKTDSIMALRIKNKVPVQPVADTLKPVTDTSLTKP